ncbi:FAD binding domain-containing protein [Pelosinus sp. sgz500959]|uniref:FAD binding domain-containing protein n=1 Tax=Pelosinus sp. sgz500959 TaxID=3242472 RepID=UPI003672081A
MVKAWNPITLEEALYIKKEHPGAVPYAGGTDWMVNPKANVPLLFLNQIPSLKEVLEGDITLAIGACSVYADLLQTIAVPEILKSAIRGIAAPAIRNIGTLGGNICNASPAGDSLPALYVLDAQVVLAAISDGGNVKRRKMPVWEFIQGVRKTALRPDELLIKILIPKHSFSHSYYQKVGARKAQAISKLSFAALANVEQSRITEFRVAFGSVGATVVRDQKLENIVSQQSLDVEKVAQVYGDILKPIDDQRSNTVYRKKVCINLLKDFILSIK